MTALRMQTAAFIGHSVNKILKDIIIKSKGMAGFRLPVYSGLGLPMAYRLNTKSNR